jgi:putative protease
LSDHSRIPAKKTLPELLAPAGSPEAFRAAIAAGADAVYLSGKRFGARKFAANFTDAEIEESVNFAHARGVRVYVTVNTLIHDREIAGTIDYLIWLYSIGVDAVLIQDIGIAALAREVIPGLVIHASTQMTIHNAEGVRWAAEQGFSRIVLARELSLTEVERIAHDTKDTGVGLEVFAHGALCYGYSGQCLLSSVIGGRSGNRGMCAQPCRKPYTLVTATTDTYGRPEKMQELPARDTYLLSPKDLCTYRHLPALVSSPIVSLKIEGRMKSAEYVAVVVAAYRQALDAIATGNTSPPPDEMNNLLLAFNRGFTAGYIFGDRHRTLMGRDAPDNRGLYIGRVSRYEAKTRTASVRIENDIFPKPGDGLFFTGQDQSSGKDRLTGQERFTGKDRLTGQERITGKDSFTGQERFTRKDTFTGQEKQEEQFGFALNTVPVRTKGEIQLVVPQPVSPNSKVYITSSVDLAARSRQIINHPSATLRHPVPLDITVQVDDRGRLTLNGRIHPGDDREIIVSHTPDITLVPAESRPLTAEQMEQQMRKSGGTPFVIETVMMQYHGDLFAPLGELNRARREFLTLAESTLIAASRPSGEQVERAKSRWQDKAPDYPATIPANSPVKSVNPVNSVTPVKSTTPVKSAPPLRLAVYADSLDAVRMAAESGGDRVYFEPDIPVVGTASCCNHPANAGIEEQIKMAVELCRAHDISLIWKFPRITRTAFSDMVLPVVPQIAGMGIAGIMVENPGMVHAIHAIAPHTTISGSTGLNVFNHATVERLSSPVQLLTLSPELSRDECRFLVSAAHRQGLDTSFAMIVQGINEAIISDDCVLEPHLHCRGDAGKQNEVFYGIRDSTGHLFPVHIDNACRTHIGNSAELCLVDHLPEIIDMGISEVVIDARGRTGAYVSEMTRIYQTAISAVSTRTAGTEKQLQALKERIKKISLGEITAGHFIRGLKES